MSKRSHYYRIMGNETSIKVGKSINISNKSWGNPIDNGLDLMIVHVNAVSQDDVAQEFHFKLMELTFFQLA